MKKDIRRILENLIKLNRTVTLEHMNSLSMVEDFDNLKNFNNYSEIYKEYSLRPSPDFVNDIDNIDKYLTLLFRDKLLKMRDEGLEKEVNLFIRNINSGRSLPYKFLNKHKMIINKLYDVVASTPGTLSDIVDFGDEYDYAIFDESSQMHLEKGSTICKYC